jgi:hypothetical protein
MNIYKSNSVKYFIDFNKWLLSNPNYYYIYCQLGKPKPFDVTLRDGLQGLPLEQQVKYNLNTKTTIYNELKSCELENIEIGSIVSDKIYPIFSDTLSFFSLVNTPTSILPINNYILIPNFNKYNKVCKTSQIKHFSLLSSVSNTFQLSNTHMTLQQSDEDISNILKQDLMNSTFKLYVSCIKECPIEGIINNDFIVNRLLKLNKFNVNKLCLSDTCGSLIANDLEYIITTCYKFGMVPSNFSLHLHVKPNRETEVEQLIHKALDLHIIDFDVSFLETGGCAKVLGNNNIKPNLSYELYYNSLKSYIIKQ